MRSCRRSLLPLLGCQRRKRHGVSLPVEYQYSKSGQVYSHSQGPIFLTDFVFRTPALNPGGLQERADSAQGCCGLMTDADAARPARRWRSRLENCVSGGQDLTARRPSRASNSAGPAREPARRQQRTIGTLQVDSRSLTAPPTVAPMTNDAAEPAFATGLGVGRRRSRLPR